MYRALILCQETFTWEIVAKDETCHLWCLWDIYMLISICVENIRYTYKCLVRFRCVLQPPQFLCGLECARGWRPACTSHTAEQTVTAVRREEGWSSTAPRCALWTPSPPLNNTALIFLRCQHVKCAERRKTSCQVDNSLWLIVSLAELTKFITELQHHHPGTVLLLLRERCLLQMFLLTQEPFQLSTWCVCMCMTSLWTTTEHTDIWDPPPPDVLLNRWHHWLIS